MSAFLGPAQSVHWTVDGVSIDDRRLRRMIESLTCAICREEYSPEHLPRALVPCGHSICSACLARLPQQQCPLCRTKLVGPIPNYSLQAQMKEPEPPAAGSAPAAGKKKGDLTQTVLMQIMMQRLTPYDAAQTVLAATSTVRQLSELLQRVMTRATEIGRGDIRDALLSYFQMAGISPKLYEAHLSAARRSKFESDVGVHMRSGECFRDWFMAQCLGPEDAAANIALCLSKLHTTEAYSHFLACMQLPPTEPRPSYEAVVKAVRGAEFATTLAGLL